MIATATLSDPVLALGVLLDPALLSEALGREVEITRVRWKPATSLVLAIRSDARHGWVAAYADAAKLDKTRERAARVAASVQDVPSAGHALAGPLDSDRVLALTLHRARRVLGDGAGEVLRYNPHRRVVIRSGDDVVKVAQPDAGRTRLTQRLAAGGLAVLPSHELMGGVHRTAWWGRGDLAGSPSGAAAAAAGRALAAIHATRPDTGARELPSGDAELATAARAIRRLDAAAGVRATRLASRLRQFPAGERRTLVHGDFTADQVLCRGAEVRLIDFDRAGLGEPERDLGAFAAGELLAGRSLHVSLRAGYDRPVDERAVARWTAAAALQRAVEPFRCARPDWCDALHAAIDVAEEAIA
jgi:hypothetical protein